MELGGASDALLSGSSSYTSVFHSREHLRRWRLAAIVTSALALCLALSTASLHAWAVPMLAEDVEQRHGLRWCGKRRRRRAALVQIGPAEERRVLLGNSVDLVGNSIDLVGGAASTFTDLCTFPLDTLKKNLQANGGSAGAAAGSERREQRIESIR
mgnify:CR=1 FL=1